MIPKLISISGPLEGAVFPITDADVNIGRGPSNSICIADPLLSRQHCRITREGEVFNLHDLGSFNGTFVNGVPIKKQAIEHGDQIKIGASILLFICHEESDSESGADPGTVRFAEDDPAMQSTIFLRREDSLYFNAPKGQTDLPPTARARSRKTIAASTPPPMPSPRGCGPASTIFARLRRMRLRIAGTEWLCFGRQVRDGRGSPVSRPP